MKDQINPYSLPYKRLLGQWDLVHPSVNFGENVRLGHGVIIEEGCDIGHNTVIGHYVVLRPHTIIGRDCMIGHLSVCEGDTVIGDRTTIHDQSHITSHAFFEDDIFIGPCFCCINTLQIKHGRDFALVLNGPTIRRAARIGARVLIMPGLEIGENAQVGAGSIVTRDIPPRECWYGAAAKFMRMVPDNELL